MTTEDTYPLTYLHLRTFQRLHFVEVEFENDGVTVIRGKNANGKSSFVDAIDFALRGRKFKGTDTVHEDAPDAWVGIGIGNLEVQRGVTKDGREKFSVRRNGATVAKPQTVLDELVAAFLDPSELLNLNEKDLANRALAIVGAGDALLRADGLIADAVEHRKEVKRNYNAQNTVATQMGDEEVERVPDEEIERLEDAASYSASVVRCCNDAQRVAQNASNDVERIQRELNEARGNLETAKAQLSDSEAQLADIPGGENTAALALESAKQGNMKWSAMKPIRAARESAARLKLEVDAAEAQVESTRAARKKMLEDVEWPTPGMGFDPDAGTLTLNGKLFSSGSTQERLFAAADMVMASGAKVPLMLIRHGNDIDNENLRAFSEYVKKRGWKALVERVDCNPEGDGFYIEDGQVFGAAAAPLNEKKEPNAPAKACAPPLPEPTEDDGNLFGFLNQDGK